MNKDHRFSYKQISSGYDFNFRPKDLANPEDMIPDGEYNPHQIHTFIIHDQGSVIGVAFAASLQDALDELADHDMLDSFLVDESDAKEMKDYACHDHKEFDKECDKCIESFDHVAYLGNAGEPFDIETLDQVEISSKSWTPDLWTLEQLNSVIASLEERVETANEEWKARYRDRYLVYVTHRAMLIME